MAKVTNSSLKPVENLSEQIIQNSNQSHVIRDSLGRTIRLKKISTMMRYKVFEVLGNELSKNEMYLASAYALFCITEIDGLIVPTLQNKAELDALIARLGDAGLEAIDNFLVETGFNKEKTQEEAREIIKK